MRTLVNSGINVTIGQQDIDDVLKNAGVNFVTDVVGTVGANYIGELYQAGRGRIDFATHKVLHGALGVGLGAIKGDPIAGALGGMVAETVADLVRDDVEVIAARVQERADQEGIEFGTQAYKNLAYQEVQGAMNWGRLGAAVTVMLSGHDVNIGLDVATNALENNFQTTMIDLIMESLCGGLDPFQDDPSNTLTAEQKQQLIKESRSQRKHGKDRLKDTYYQQQVDGTPLIPT